MKILVGNHHLATYGGSESYTLAIAEELIRIGHTVELITIVPEIADPVRALRIPVNELSGGYDLALLSHNTTVEEVYRRFPGLPIIQTIHGMHSLEFPHPDAKLVAISEELGKRYNCKVIHQGVNLERFRPLTPINKEPKALFSLSQSESFNLTLSRLCNEYGVKFVSRNKHTNGTWDIENEINRADIVVSIGRGVYEAMACGREVIVADARDYNGAWMDGLIMGDDSYEYMLRCNCSGRANALPATETNIRRALDMYAQSAGEQNRRLAEKHHDIRKAVEAYLA